MSNSLWSLFSLAVLILLIPLSSSFSIQLYPPVLNFTYFGDEVCSDLYIRVDKPVSIHLTDLWSNFPEKSPIFYNESLEVLDYEKDFIINSEKRVTVCLKEESLPLKYGLLLLEIENTGFASGIWVEILADSNFLRNSESDSKALFHLPDSSIIFLHSLSRKDYFFDIFFFELVFLFEIILFFFLMLICKNLKQRR